MYLLYIFRIHECVSNYLFNDKERWRDGREWKCGEIIEDCGREGGGEVVGDLVEGERRKSRKRIRSNKG